MTATEIQPQRIRAHELYGDFWFNSEPIPITAQHGRVVLLFFWDYTCAHCLHSLPYIVEWSKKYREHGLLTIGVHTPKFPFGKNPENVQRAIERLHIEFPVVMDNEGLIGSNYGQRTWPSMYVVDRFGFVRFENSREGNYLTTERVIQTLLYDAGADDSLPLLMEPLHEEDRADAICFKATPEIFAGYIRGSIGNVEGFSPESIVEYADPQLYLNDRIYAVGNWMNGKNSLELSAEEQAKGKIMLSYHALEVNAVIEPRARRAEVLVLQDDEYLTHENKGSDVLITHDGRSHILLDEPRMYNLVKNPEYGEHLLQLRAEKNGFALYSFTCTGGVIPEFISTN
jgi:thiol-disulfide isomerase/thioredoxin